VESELAERCAALAERLQLANAADVCEVESLTGGVSSEIALVTLPDRQVCAKFALAKLKVEADWFAPLHRNLAEYRWLQYAAQLAPDNVPRLFGHDEELGGFMMEFVSGNEVRNWKAELLTGRLDAEVVGEVARVLARLHSGGRSPVPAADFDNRTDFEALRIEPYLLSLKQRHPALADQIDKVAASLRSTGSAIIHGDVSPKNILLRGNDPIILDAECATIGDPAFDVAFCLNHFILKGTHLPRKRADFVGAARLFSATYFSGVDWEDPAELAHRVATLLPLLLLARVDGKSPVEYLSLQQQDDVRAKALLLVNAAPASPDDLFDCLQEEFA